VSPRHAPSGSVVTIGNFDGVHRGHLALVDRTVALAADRGLPAVALTFDPHPAAVLRPEAVPDALQSVPERVAVLRAHGIEDVIVVPFDAALAARTAEDFVRGLLVDRLHAVVVVVGQNFRFGAGAAGDVRLLAALGEQHGFSVEAVALVDLDGGPVSSSALRALLADGDVAAVARGLGRRFTLTGEVVRGEGRGRTIGVPTANVAVAPGRALPADGVYACWAWPGGAAPVGPRGDVLDVPGRVPAVVNVGWRPTFDGTTRTVEAHLLLEGGRDGPDEPGRTEAGGPDLYGRPLTLAFIDRIRGEERFDGPGALVARIREDAVAARALLRPGRAP
jgi:riboflavin kinase / FMN adenylyltransferase